MVSRQMERDYRIAVAVIMLQVMEMEAALCCIQAGRRQEASRMCW